MGVVLLRVAVDTAAQELMGRGDVGTFARLLATQAGVKPRTPRRIHRAIDNANSITHGARNATLNEAKRMLRLVTVIGGAWCDRLLSPEEVNV